MATDPTPGDRVTLVVLFGGQSAEHDVSRVTAAHVLRAADPSKYEVRAIGITREGDWLMADDELTAALTTSAGPAALEVAGRPTDALPVLAEKRASGPTVVLPLLHGPMGEDGTVQGMLELAGVPYVGAGVLSSALCMDKAMAKQVLAGAGIAQARWATRRASEIGPRTAAELAGELGLPLFVKPANLGSSVGVTKAGSVDEVERALTLALAYDEWVVVEEAISGREVEVAVLGNEEPRASVPGEIIPGHEFYDYEDKYLDDGARLLIPAPLSDADSQAVRDLALTAYRALRCEGMARVDFFFEEGGRGFLCNELNTIPGFTPISMFPKLWQASGLPYGELIDELVRLAVERHGRRRRATHR